MLDITSKYFSIFKNKPPASWVEHITRDFLTCYSCWNHSSMYVKLGHFDKYFVKNTRIRGPKGKHFQDFSTKYLPFSNVQKGQQKPPLSPLPQYPWICLNSYPWKCLNKMFYARALNMHDHLTCSTGFWKCLGL